MSRNPENNAEPWQRILGKYRYEDLSPEDQQRINDNLALVASSPDPVNAFLELVGHCWTQQMQDAFGTGEEGENSPAG